MEPNKPHFRVKPAGRYRIIPCEHCGVTNWYSPWSWGSTVKCKTCREPIRLPQGDSKAWVRRIGLGFTTPRLAFSSLALVLAAIALLLFVVSGTDRDSEELAGVGEVSAEAPAEVYLVPGSSHFHTKDCSLIGATRRGAMSRNTAMRLSFEPCPLCMMKKESRSRAD